MIILTCITLDAVLCAHVELKIRIQKKGNVTTEISNYIRAQLSLVYNAIIQTAVGAESTRNVLVFGAWLQYGRGKLPNMIAVK